tara:strand:- start:1321 stop:2499 length:1179 start_codon:yes stop_codon:yes gene_type:complete
MSETIQDKEKAPLKIKKPKKLINQEQVESIKVDLSKKPETDAVPEQSTGSVDENQQANDVEKVEEGTSEPIIEQASEQEEKEEVIPIEEITETEDEIKEVEAIEKQIVETKEEINKEVLPENIQSLIDFMKETGGTIEDYARLNRDYSKLNEAALLNEYYKTTKPHLNQEEISFIIEDNFLVNEDVDDEREIKKKKLAYKEEIAKAKYFLEETKNKYYKEIKLRSSGLTPEQQKAVDFFNRHNKEQEKQSKVRDIFLNQTKNTLNQDFKGFEYNIGEKKFRYKVNNPEQIAKDQSNLNDFVKKFLNKDGAIEDAKGYHKAFYTASNADAIANHFYEQGKADAVRDIAAKSKNITQEARPQQGGEVYINGLRVKAISGVDSSKLKFKKITTKT